jgi:hypothetical protein
MRRNALAGILAAAVAVATVTVGAGAGQASTRSAKPPTQGLWLVDIKGDVYTTGTAPKIGSVPSGQASTSKPVVGIAGTSDGKGYWVADADGTVWNFGDAKKLRFPVNPASPIVGIVGVGTNGYVVVAANGGVFAYGGARFHGSVPGILGAKKLAAPIVGIGATPGEHGYWLAGADGSIFSFGNAKYHGTVRSQIGSTHLRQVIVGIGALPDGSGYWMVARDGGIFSFGRAHFYGSLPEYLHNHGPGGGFPPSKTKWVIGMLSSPDGGGYWIASNVGHTYTFGSSDRLAEVIPAARLAGIAATA